MFFKKSKRIKELEKENEELRRLTNTVQLKDKHLLTIKEFKIEKIMATGEFPPWYNHKIMEDEVKHQLALELSPFVKVEKEFDEVSDKWLIRASIKVVKE